MVAQDVDVGESVQMGTVVTITISDGIEDPPPEPEEVQPAA